MDDTPNLALPYLLPSQALRYITHNAALATLDTLVQLAVLDRTLTAPPGSPAEGDRHLVAVGATGVWSGEAGRIAAYNDGSWVFHRPVEGFLAWVVAENLLLVYADADWLTVTETISVLQDLTRLGIGTVADGTHQFAAKLASPLWTAVPAGEGGSGDLRMVLNKETAANIVSVLLQRGFSGRAEIGLVGDDDLTLKVSADGASWTTALTLDKDDGTARFVAGSVTAPAVQIGDADSGFYETAGAVHLGVDGVEMARQGAVGLALGAGFDATEALHIKRTGTAFARLVVEGENGVNNLAIRHSADATGPSFNLRKGRGTLAARTAPNQNDVLGQMSWQYWDGVALGRAAVQMQGRVIAAVPSATDGQSRLEITLAGAGSVTQTEVMRLETATGLSLFGANPVIDAERHFRLRPYTVATLPTASPAAQLIYVSDGTLNKRLAVSDGTSWRWPDGIAVS
ncbi:MAG: hypothetical protein JWR75_882 [Devosia sp.]|nr:hypothetical protein [Devosia sp.]